MDLNHLLRTAQKHLLANYRQPPFVLSHGRGCEVFDTEGKSYLDFCAGIAVSSLGHAHPRLTAAIAEQAGRLMHMSNYFYNAENVQLAGELCETLGFDRAFFCNSGAEANEAMLKLARHHYFSRGEPSRYRVVAFDNAFHGRTLGALALTGTPKYKEGFGPTLEGVTHVPYGSLDAVGAAMGPDVAAILVEPIQGEGGITAPPPGFLAALRQIADAQGSLLLIDEVQTGIARTGRWLGADHDGVKADAVSLAKGLGGGFPIGALLLRESLAAALPPGTHGSTFGGNALASAAARTVLRVIKEDGLVEQAEKHGRYLGRGLAALAARHPKQCLGERGCGLLRGLVLVEGTDLRAMIDSIRGRGVLVTAAGANVLRFTPPLVVGEAEIDAALQRIDALFADLG